ncbi:MAG: LTA synthase family protein [Cellvibrionaceae bacterium]
MRKINFLNIPNFPIAIFAYLVLVISIYFICYKLPLSWTVENFSRKTGPLRYDSFVILGYTASLLCLSLFLRFRFLFIVAGGVVGIVVLSTASSWLYYDFYKDFIVADTLRLLPDLLNGKAAAGLVFLNSYNLVLFLLCAYLVFLVFWVFLALRSSNDIGERKTLCALFFCFLLLGGVNHYKFYKLDSNVLFSNTNMPPIDVNPASYFFRSFFNENLNLEFNAEHLNAIKRFNLDPSNNEYPLYREGELYSGALSDSSGKKNVIVLVMESVRAAETGFFSGNAQSTTPNIDLIAKQTDTFTNYYSNTVQTVRAEVSILCSILDFSRGTPISRRGIELFARCLPAILKENGYSTLWFHGNEKDYFNRDYFLPLIGFDELHDEKLMLKANAGGEILGWGLSDKDSLKYTFDFLEKKKDPFFAEILTLSNHFPFDFNFDKSAQESTEYSTVYNQFLRGVQYTDQNLGLFWEMFQNSKLKDNTILIITSDHGLWFQEKIFEDIYSANEALFRVPLMIWRPNNKKVNTYNTVSSHIDITPTILNMLGISAENTAFMGEDLYSDTRQEFALMTGFGAYAVRDKEQFCFPLSNAKENGYYVEKRIDNPHNIVCRLASNNALARNYESDKSLKYMSPADEYKKIIEFNDISLLKGFMPHNVIEKINKGSTGLKGQLE